MHLTLKKESYPPGPLTNSLQQQARFDEFLKEFNEKGPTRRSTSSAPPSSSSFPRRYEGLPEVHNPCNDRDDHVTAGAESDHRKRVNVSTVLAGQRLGIKAAFKGIWIVSFMSYESWFHRPGAESQPLDNPSGPRLSPMLLKKPCPETSS